MKSDPSDPSRKITPPQLPKIHADPMPGTSGAKKVPTPKTQAAKLNVARKYWKDPHPDLNIDEWIKHTRGVTRP